MPVGVGVARGVGWEWGGVHACIHTISNGVSAELAQWHYAKLAIQAHHQDTQGHFCDCLIKKEEG